MKTVLVTGANGQLGKCLHDIVSNLDTHRFVFASSNELDITSKDQIERTFNEQVYDYCINCAAYTAVDKAEKEENKAFMVNAEGVRLLAETCKKYNTILIHISTDFVFDGTKKGAYFESDQTNPLSVYGESKLRGENYIKEILENFIIIRTSWVYSEHGNNFVKTMLKLSKLRTEIKVVCDQLGSPTYAPDLAKFLLRIVCQKEDHYGVFHYSNSGTTTWYDFAIEIFKQKGINTRVIPVLSKDYISLAARPKNSKLSLEKTVNRFNINSPSWQDSLKRFLRSS